MKETFCLEEECVLFGGMLLRYRLEKERESGSDSGFSVRVNLGNEECVASLGSNLSFALDCYRMLVCGRVTPCTLNDVVEDWNYEGKIF